MIFGFKSRFVFAALVCVFASTLFWNRAAHAEEKNIPVSIQMNSQLGTTSVGDAASADAVAHIGQLEDNPDQGAEGAKFTYSWSHVSTEYRTDPNGTWQTSQTSATVADTGTISTTVSTDFDAAAYYRIKIKISVDFVSG